MSKVIAEPEISIDELKQRDEKRNGITVNLLTQYQFITTPDKTVWVYEGGIYKPVGEQIIHIEVVKAMGIEYLESDTTNVIARVQAKTFMTWEDFNKGSEDFICLENGVLDLRYWTDCEFKARADSSAGFEVLHDLGFGIHIVKLPFKYNPKAEYPTIKKFFNEVLKSQEDIDAMIEWFAYHLIKSQPYQKASIWIGVGSNGKTVMANLLRAFLGKDNYTNLTLEQICNNRFASSGLFGKLASIGSEMSGSRLKDTEMFKKIVGGESINAERKFKDSFDFFPDVKLTFYGNKTPSLRSQDDCYAYFRRFISFEFPNIFEGDKKDEHLIEKLTTPEELSGLLNWVLEGLSRLIKNRKFSNEKPWEEIRTEYLVHSDIERAFIDAEIESQEDDVEIWVTTEECYQAYKEFCKKHDKQANSKNLLSIRIQESTNATIKFKHDDKTVRIYSGIRLKNKPVNQEPVETKPIEDSTLDSYGEDSK